MDIKKLRKYGFDNYFNNEYITNRNKKDSSEFPARVIAQLGEIYTLLTEKGIFEAKVMGKFIYNARENKDYPVVGDFVITKDIDSSMMKEIIKVLDRKNTFSRKMPISGGRKLHNGAIDGGTTEEQVMAANIDYAFILCSLDNNFNISRLERYLLLAKKSKLHIIIILTKLDVCNDYPTYVNKVKEVVNDVEIIGVSSITNQGIDLLSGYIQPEKTVVLLGSSGVGKSTLLNTLFEKEVQKTNVISNHSGKGKHTTTHRQMFIHQSGCMIIDNPGIKELQLWADEKDLELIYSDIIELSNMCKYSNCTHSKEPGCAVREAIEKGQLSIDRYIRYKKVLTEIVRLSQRKKEYSKMKKRGMR